MELKYDNGILKIPIRLLENLRLKFESTGTVNIDRYKDFIIIRDKLNTKHNFFETLEINVEYTPTLFLSNLLEKHDINDCIKELLRNFLKFLDSIYLHNRYNIILKKSPNFGVPLLVVKLKAFNNINEDNKKLEFLKIFCNSKHIFVQSIYDNFVSYKISCNNNQPKLEKNFYKRFYDESSYSDLSIYLYNLYIKELYNE